MTNTLVASLAPLSFVDKTTIIHSANLYLREMLGNQYQAVQPVQAKSAWQCLIQFCSTDPGKKVIAGQIEIDARTGCVIPLAPATLYEVQQRVAVHYAKERGQVARDDNGYILPYLARIKVNGYLTDTITMFASAEGDPLWVGGDKPQWRVKTVLRLRGQGTVRHLGYIDVNAVTGDAIPAWQERENRYAVLQLTADV